MWWLKYLLLFSSIYLSECQNESVTEEEFAGMLDDAVVEVLAQHAESSSKSRSPPYFNMPEGFMHPFVPGTGVGNREELIIDAMVPLPVFDDVSFSRFLFKHFNNTDYVAGISENYMVLMKINRTFDNYLMLSNDDIVITSQVDSGVIKDVVLFTRIVDNFEVMSVAVATETMKASVVYIYEVFGDIGIMVSMIDLNIDPSRGSNLVKKIAYVQSSHGGSLVVLTETTGGVKLSYNQRGHSKLNHYIEVNFPSAVDLVTFTVQGHGYIAVANTMFCEVYKMDEFVASHIHFDRLGPFPAVVDLEYFRLGFHHFLAVADFETQYLYTWKKGEFAIKQKIAIPNMAQIYATSVQSCRDEVMLLFIKWDGNVDLHVFSGEKEDFKKVDVGIPEGYTVRSGTVTSFTSQGTVVILFSDLEHKHGAFVIKTSLKSLRDPLLAQGEEISKVMKGIQDMMHNQKKEIKRIQKLLESAVRSTGTQHITSVQYFDDISATNGTEVQKVNEIIVEWEDSMLTLQEYRRGAVDLEKTVENLEHFVAEIESAIPDVVRLDQDTVITGHKTFTGGVSVEHLMTTSLNLQNVAGVDLPQLQKDIYRLDNPEMIEGILTFKEPLTVTGNFDVGATVNGIDISEEVMTTDTEQISDARMIFTNPVVVKGNLDISGKISGIDISEEVVTLDGSHHITAHKNFVNGVQAENVTTRLLDGIDIDDLYKRAFTISGDQTVTADVLLSTITTNNIILNGRLNGYDVKELEKSIVRIDQPATISGYKIFTSDVKVEGELTVHGTVNGLKIPDDLVLVDRTQIITGTKEFLGHVTAHKVEVHGLVDGLKLPEDIVTLTKDEEISSTLYFADGIVAEKDITVEGLVDGVDISEIAKQAMKLNESNTFQHAVFLGPVTVTGDLNVKGLVNGIDLKKFLGDVVYRDEKPIKITSQKNFGTVFADKIKLENFINGFNINVDFMKVRGDQTISGTKIFKKTTFNSIFIEDGMVDGVDIADLYQQRIKLELESEESIDKEIEFVDNVIVRDLTVNGTINGIRIPEDVVRRNFHQTISNKHFANTVVVDNLIIDGDITVDNFGGINLTEFYNDRITLTGNQGIPGDLWLGNATASEVSISGLVNGVNINEFADNVMSKTKPYQVVTAAKEFSGNVTIFGDIRTSEGINGYNLSDINRRAFKLVGDNVVTAELEFEENITFTNLVVERDINGVNITRLVEDSLRKTGDIQYVTGDTVFEDGFAVVGDIIATKVNGMVLEEDVLLKSIPQTINGQFTFKNMAIDGDLTVNGLVNGLNLAEIVPKLARIDDEEIVIESNVTFAGSIRVQEDIDVTGTINEIDFKQLFDNVLRKTGNQTITGHKTFKGNVTVTGDIDVKYVNGINWKQFLDDVVWIDRPQAITSRKIFKEDVIVENDLFVSGSTRVQLVNGKDLNKFLEDAVYIDQPANITGPIIFKNPVEITGDMNADWINGLNLKTDVITITCSDDGPQVITGQKTFEVIKVFGDIITDSVNSYNLQELYEDTLLTEGNQTITGRKIIYGDAVFKKDVYPDTVNGMILNKELVTLDTEQEIEGPLIFQGDVFVKNDMFINGLVNGVDLHNLSRDAVYLETEQVIEGTYTLENVVVQSNVEVSGTVNDIDLVAFDKNVTKFLAETQESIDIMDTYADDQCQLAKYLQESLEDSYYALDEFVFHQDLELPASFVQTGSERDITLVSVDILAAKTTSVKSIWDDVTNKFSVSDYSVTSIARTFEYQIGNIALTVNVGINSKDSSLLVGTAGHSIPLQNSFTDASVILREANAAIALMFPDKNTCDVYILKEDPEKGYSFELDSSLHIGKESTSLVIFDMSGVLYLAVSCSHSPFVTGFSQIYVNRNKNWQLTQRIQSSGPFVKHFKYHNYHYLAFANNAPVYETKEPKSIQIYRNSGFHESVFVLFQKVPFDDARGTEVFQFGDLMQLHLVAWNETRIQIFALEGESGMKGLFTMYEKCVRDVKPIFIGDSFYLVVGRQNLDDAEIVKSLLYKGLTKGLRYKPYKLSYC